VLNLDPSLGCDSATFQQCSDRALSSWKVVGDAFRVIFPISARLPPDQPNPFLGWFLKAELFGGPANYYATFHASEQLFDALITGLDRRNPSDSVSLKFFRQFDQDV